MHKIGITSSKTVLVEMSKEEFDALSKISGLSRPHPKQKNNEAANMSFAEKLNFVKPRIIKLAPKKLDTLTHGIKTMFNFSGGINDSEAKKLISKLKQEKIISISNTNKITYNKS